MKKIAFGVIAAAVIIGIVLWLGRVPDVPALDSTADTQVQVSEGSGLVEDLSPVSENSAKSSEQTNKNNITIKNGMKIETTKEGTGAEIKNGQVASMLYTGMLADGSVFDSTSKRNDQPLEFTLGAGQVIQGWEQGILGMKVGEERTLTIPAELGYGAAGYPPVIPQNATLTFTVKLVAIK